MPTLWEKIERAIKEGSFAALTKSEEIAQVGKLKMNMAMLHRNINSLFAELGGKVYHKVVEEGAEDVIQEAEIQKLLDKIEAYENDLRKKEERLRKIEDDL